MIAAGGAAGATLRFLTALGTARLLPGSRVLTGTVTANVIGCLSAGIFLGLVTESVIVSGSVISFLSIGLLGAYTTFSTFSLEIVQRLNSPLKELLAYLSLQLIGALGLLFTGYFATLWIAGV